MQVKVKEKAILIINGNKTVFEKGEYELEDNKALILINAGYAEKVEGKSDVSEKEKTRKTKGKL